MSDQGIMQELVELLLGWMRLVTAWVWDFFQADMGTGFVAWFSHNWIKLALVMIVLGVFIDWLIWMIRWRPYWLWLRKRQIIYEEVPQRRSMRRTRPARGKRAESGENVDIFDSQEESDPYAPVKQDDWTNWDSSDDPYANAKKEEK